MGDVQGFGNGVDERQIALGHPFFDQSPESADEIDIHVLGGLVQGLGHLDHAPAVEGSGGHGDGADRNALVDHGNAVAVANFVAHRDQIPGQRRYPFIYCVGESGQIVGSAVEQADAKGHCAYVQILVLDHGQGGKNLAVVEHAWSPKLYESFQKCRGAGPRRQGRIWSRSPA